MERIMKIDYNGQIDILESETISDIRKIIKKDINNIFEIVRPRGLEKEYLMLVDEEGQEKNLNINRVGCHLYQTETHGIPIVGPIYIVRNEDEELKGLSNEDLIFLLTKFIKFRRKKI